MYQNTSASRRRTAREALFPALAILLVLTLLILTLLAGCGKDPEETPAQSAAPETTQTTAAPESTAPVESAATAEPVSTEPAETGPAMSETLPADWEPSLNRSDISFFGAGESFVLTVPGAPASLEILWSAEDEEIASIDQNGRVTAVGPGSARVYAELLGTKLSCWIRCQFDAPPAEDEPTLNNTDISFFGPGESYRLSVSNVPEGTEVLWSSEDYGVASVDENGRVRAVGPGTIRVKALVGEQVLSCWVRCQFAAPELPRSSVADGSWRVTLHKSSITALDEEAGIYVAQAELLSRIQVTQEELEGLEPYSKLDLSRFGLGSFRVSSVEFNFGGSACTVTSEAAVLLFSLEDGLWTLVDATGEARYYSAGTARFVFTDDSRVYAQAGTDELSRVRLADVVELFGRKPGFEETITPVALTVDDGLVTKALWQYAP